MAERKYFDSTWIWNPVSGQQANSNGVLVPFTIVTQGQTDIQRIGDKATGTSIELRMWMAPISVSLAEQPNPFFLFRMTIFIWKDDTAPVMGDIYNTTVPIQFQNLTALYPFNHDKKVKRKVIYDRVLNPMVWQDGTNIWSMSSDPQPFIKLVIPLKKYGALNIVNFQGASTTAVNHIYLMVSSNVNPANTDSNWSILAYGRYNFIDM